jgi:hypothetical protein
MLAIAVRAVAAVELAVATLLARGGELYGAEQREAEGGAHLV